MYTTARLHDGHTWTGEGWERPSRMYSVYYEAANIPWNACGTDVVLAQPTITGNTCLDGVYTPPSATFGPTTAVTYSNVTVTEPSDGVYLVSANATLADGYAFARGGFTSGWGGAKGEGIFYNGTMQRTPCEQSGGDNGSGDNGGDDNGGGNNGIGFSIAALVAALIRILQMILGSRGR